jgi:hypothetical protein
MGPAAKLERDAMTSDHTLLEQALMDLNGAGSSLASLLTSDPNVKELWEVVQSVETEKALAIAHAVSEIDHQYQDRVSEAKTELGLMIMMLAPRKE